MNIVLSEVLGSHNRMMVDGYVSSVVPEVVDIGIDPDAVVAMVGGAVNGRFSRRGLVVARPTNHVEGSTFTFSNGGVDIEFAKPPSDAQRALSEATAELITPIDEHFRQLANLTPDVPTVPMVAILGGVFSGRNPTDTNRHFDFGARRPVVQYKMCYLGAIAHSSVYYPGGYRMPSRTQGLAKALGGVDTETPTPLFNRKDEQRVSMPANVVCIEPWNAYHSGPTDKKARGTRRGVLAVGYDLDRISW